MSLARATGEFDIDAHHHVARGLAADSIVLLKNSGVLPLRNGSTIAVIGAFATKPRSQGGGSSHVNPTRTDRALDEIRTLAADRSATVLESQGFALTPDDSAAQAESLRFDAVAVAGRADVAIVFAGLSEREESEGFDRTSIELPAEQID